MQHCNRCKIEMTESELPITKHLGLLDITIHSNLNFAQQIESISQAASTILSLLSSLRRYFSTEQLLSAAVTSLDGAAKYHLEILDPFNEKHCRFINNEKLSNSKLHTLEHHCRVDSLSVFYKMHFEACIFPDMLYSEVFGNSWFF